jgi:hypothetical protein
MTPPPAPAWQLALEGSWLGHAMRESLWLYPAVETTHIAAFVLVVGGIAVFDLRLLGLGRSVPLRQLARLTLPVVLGAFAVAAGAGSLLFVTEASAYGANPLFPVKLGLIALAGLNALAFHTVTARRLAVWEAPSPPLPARLHGAASMLCWAGALVCGRLLAYV